MIFPKLHISLERWKWNEEYGIWVSNHGRFKSDKKKDLKVKTNGKDYLSVKSYKQDKFVLAHRLVMITWKPIDNADEMTVDHLDHNKRNNKLRNLEWVTREENLKRAKEDFETKPKKEKAKFIVTSYTLEHFYCCCNGLYFTDVVDVLNYMKTQQSHVRDHHRVGIENAFKTLVNAYNNQNPEYVTNGFKKTLHNCELSIVKKG